MTLKINQTFTVIISFLLLMTYFAGLPIASFFKEVIFSTDDNTFNMFPLILGNIDLLASNLDSLIVGIWLYKNSNKMTANKWTWLMLGFTYGFYSLIFYAAILIQKKVIEDKNLFKSLKPILLQLIIAVALKYGMSFLTQPLILTQATVHQQYFITYFTTYISSGLIGTMILINLYLAINLISAMKHNFISRKSIWFISTLVLGLFPIILFNLLLILRERDNKESGF